MIRVRSVWINTTDGFGYTVVEIVDDSVRIESVGTPGAFQVVSAETLRSDFVEI